MELRIILPVKRFGEAKQRLAVAMTPAARANLAEEMFRHVFATASAFAGPAAIIVISNGPDVLDFARSQGGAALTEHSPTGLNSALQQAAGFARYSGAAKLLIAASDLPLLSVADLAALAQQHCAVASDRHGNGTNALLWPASPLPDFCFGENSFARHLEAARAAGHEPHIIARPGLAHDIDLPADLMDQPG